MKTKMSQVVILLCTALLLTLALRALADTTCNSLASYDGSKYDCPQCYQMSSSLSSFCSDEDYRVAGSCVDAPPKQNMIVTGTPGECIDGICNIDGSQTSNIMMRMPKEDGNGCGA